MNNRRSLRERNGQYYSSKYQNKMLLFEVDKNKNFSIKFTLPDFKVHKILSSIRVTNQKPRR